MIRCKNPILLILPLTLKTQNDYLYFKKEWFVVPIIISGFKCTANLYYYYYYNYLTTVCFYYILLFKNNNWN